MIPFIICGDEHYNYNLSRLLSKMERFKTVSERWDPDPTDDRWTKNRIDNLYATMQLEGHPLWKEQIVHIIEEHFSSGINPPLKLACKVAELYENCSAFCARDPGVVFQILQRLDDDKDRSENLYRQNESVRHFICEYTPVGVDARQIPELMDQLFETLLSPHFQQVEKAFMVHFGLQAIQPFNQNDGIIGRFWQTLLMEEEYPLFRFVRVDDLTYKYRSDYQQCLFKSVEKKDPTEFITFMLKITDAAVKEFVVPQRALRGALERIRYVHKHDLHEFSRKDYMNIMEHISAPTASRDLAIGVQLGFFQRKGTKRLTLYSCLEQDQRRKES